MEGASPDKGRVKHFKFRSVVIIFVLIVFSRIFLYYSYKFTYYNCKARFKFGGTLKEVRPLLMPLYLHEKRIQTHQFIISL